MVVPSLSSWLPSAIVPLCSMSAAILSPASFEVCDDLAILSIVVSNSYESPRCLRDELGIDQIIAEYLISADNEGVTLLGADSTEFMVGS